MNTKANIIIIEDEKNICNFIETVLSPQGYQVTCANTGTDGLKLIESLKPDVVLLDLGLPDIDGMEVLKQIRQQSNTPIIVVSARGQEREKISALDQGADDYVTKPFSAEELLARIRVAIRKSEQSSGGSELGESFECDYLRIDFVKRMVFIDGKEIHVTPIEYKLLTLLVSNRGKVLTHNYIQSKIWGYGEGGDPNSLRVFMATLRRKIEKDTTNPRFIITEVGVGYRFSE